MISIIIPCWLKTQYHVDLLDKCVRSLSDYDELIIVSNEGTGYTKNVNLGLQMAKGDFLMVVNNDIEWRKGSLDDLCIQGTVTSPFLNGGGQPFWGPFFVLPREVYEKVGPLDEQFMLYCSDTDYFFRIKEAGVPTMGIEKCDIFSEGGRTMKEFGARREIIDNEDMAKFVKKWGRKPDTGF